MASRRCGCASDQCSCLITAGEGIEVSGLGTKSSPYVIDAGLPVSNLAIQDENSTVQTSVTSLDFTGPGVTASVGDVGEVVDTIPGGVAGVTTTVTSFTANGTWNKPANLLWIMVELVGGGGGSGGLPATSATQNASSGGGGGGGYTRRVIPAASIAESTAVTVGAGGTAGASNGAGGTGGTTSFGPLCSALGGVGSAAGVSAASGGNAYGTTSAGGLGTGGDVNIQGGPGGPGGVITGRATLIGIGGDSQMGKGGLPAFNANGAVGQNYGGGAGGSTSDWSQAARAGVAGASGFVIVTAYIKT